MAQVVDDHADSALLEQVVKQVPAELADVSADRLGDPAVMSPDQLRRWIQQLTPDHPSN